MNDHTTISNSVRARRIRAGLSSVNSARGLNNGAKRLLHILRHLDLVIAPLPMKAQHGNSPLIDSYWIYLAIALRVGNHFASAFKANVRPIHAAASVFESKTVAFKVFAHAIKFAHSRHSAAAIHLDVISPQEIILAIELPPRNVHVHPADSVVVMRRHFFELGKIASS